VKLEDRQRKASEEDMFSSNSDDRVLRLANASNSIQKK